MSDTLGDLTRDETIDEIVALEAECEALRARIEAAKSKSQTVRGLAKKGFVHFLLGRRLTRSLSDFLAVAGTDRSRILGPELARTLDATTGKVIGRKRTITIIALLAASPAILSLWLLLNGLQITKQQKEDAAFTAQLFERSNWLSIIYTTNESSMGEGEKTPIYSIRGRGEAVLALMAHDLERLKDRPTDFWGNVSRVNIDGAPLAGINLTSIKNEPPVKIERVSFRGSALNASNFEGSEIVECRFNEGYLSWANLKNARFEKCRFWGTQAIGTDARGAVFEDCDFSEAILRGANFEGARFLGDCVFEKTLYDREVTWPVGFDPEAAGAVAIPEERRRGGTQ